MNVRESIRASLSLLSARDRRRLVAVSILQMSTSLLDLLGVLLIGLVTALAVSSVSGGSTPTIVTDIESALGLSGTPTSALVVWLAGIAALLLIAKSLIGILLSRRVLRFLARRQHAVSAKLAAALLAEPLVQVQRRGSQETAYALTSGVTAATLIILGQGVIAATEATLLIVLAIGLFIVSPVVTIFTVVFFAIIAVLLQRVLSGWAWRLGERVSLAEIRGYAAVQESLRAYREIVVSKRRGLYVESFSRIREDASLAQSDQQFVALLPKYVFEVALVVGAGLLAASQFMTKDVDAAVAVIAVFLAAGSRILPSILRLQGAVISVRTASGQAQPTFALAAELGVEGTGSAVDDGGGSVQSRDRVPAAAELREQIGRGHPDFTPTVVVRDASFTYPGADHPALRGASLEISAGQSLALVGSTGAGKSTLADVILGVLHPQSGTVEIGGLDPLSAISRWPGGMAYVPQDVAMSAGTVRQNVALGLPADAIDDDLVWEALERAHLARFLRESRSGLDTVIGESGVRLSGGQRQRLGVARALYTRPRLLVLDEATSALDAETEQAIAQTLRDLEGEVTTVTIAHRLATIRHCDLVLYLEQGAIVGRGSFEAVRAQSAAFDQQAALLGL